MPPEFARAVLALVARIPPGHVSTYGRLAELAGWPRHARHVGHLLGHLPDGMSVPWQRVVGAGGRIARPGTPGADQQRLLLEHEGVELTASGRVDLERYGWPGAGEDV